MKKSRLENGIAIAIIRRSAGAGPSRLAILKSPVQPADLRAAVDGFLRGGKIADFAFKAIAFRKDEPSLDAWLKQSGIALDGRRLLEDGDSRELEFSEETGRLLMATVSVTRTSPVSPLPSSTGPVRVLIVDDSKAMRMVLRKILESSPKFKVIGEADRPSEALRFLEKEKPDVLTLDIQMPEMSGVELFKQVRDLYKIPAVMVSALGMNEGREVMDALEAGAFDYFQKPDAGEIQAQAGILHEKVLAAAMSGKRSRPGAKRVAVAAEVSLGALGKLELLAVGASTGGTEAIREVFESLPADIPPTVVVQHIPPFFSAAFAERLNKLCRFEVREAREGDVLQRGLALIAPGGKHLEVERTKGGKVIAHVTDGEPVNRFKPSVDVLFHSVAKYFGKDATGVILTGMGNDGAKGMLAMRKAGSRTLGQDEESSIVYGMPRAAAELGAVSEVVSLDQVAAALSQGAKKAA